MFTFLRPIKRVLIVSLVILITIQLAACGIATPVPTVTAITTSSPTPIAPSITPSYTPSAIPLPTNTYTASLEPDIAPNCKIANEPGQLYLLSEKKFRDLRTTEGKLNKALALHYPEWAHYTQMVSWDTQPVKLGEIIVSASLNEQLNLQINPAVTLITLGESMDWQLPANTDLFLKSREISEELEGMALDWVNPQNEGLRSQYPEVANSATYTLYAYFNYKLDRLQSWCNTYQRLFETPP